jgi:hypothetical protein
MKGALTAWRIDGPGHARLLWNYVQTAQGASVCWGLRMFAAVRRLFGRFAVALCAISILLPATVEGHALWNSDDPGCAPTRVASGQTPTHVTSAPAFDASGHCALCHWLRAIAGAMPTETAITPSPLEIREISITRFAWWHDELLPLEPPARAPPSSVLR